MPKAQQEPPTVDVDAVVRLARDIAAALNRFADRLTTPPPPAPGEGPVQLGRRKAGPRQQRILDLLELAPEGGVPTSAVAAALGMQVPNVHNALVRLADLGVVEKVPDEEPAHWRLASAE